MTELTCPPVHAMFFLLPFYLRPFACAPFTYLFPPPSHLHRRGTHLRRIRAPVSYLSLAFFPYSSSVLDISIGFALEKS